MASQVNEIIAGIGGETGGGVTNTTPGGETNTVPEKTQTKLKKQIQWTQTQ